MPDIQVVPIDQLHSTMRWYEVKEHSDPEMKQGLMFSRSIKYGLPKSLIGLVLYLAISLPLCASDGLFDKGLSRAEAAADLNFYFQVIDQQHGNPYQYISREVLRALVDEKIANLPEQLSYKELSSELFELNQKLRCGHTSLSFDQNLFEEAASQPYFFPFPVRIIDGDIYIDFEDESLPYASRLATINGMETDKVLRELSVLPVTDGFIETKVLRDIEKKFGYYFFLRYGAYNTFRVAYTQPNGEQMEATIAGNTARKMLSNNYYRPVYKTHERYIHFTHLDAIDSLHTLVLTLNTFNTHPEWLYNRIMSQYDEESKQFDFDNLVIDLRNNEGGDRRLLNILYQLVAGKALSDPSVNSTRNLDIITEQLQAINGSVERDAVLKAEDYLQNHFSKAAPADFMSEEIDWYANEFKLDINLSDLQFKGQVYVLTSGNTFSAAADLARVLSQLGNVKLIGEETGGAHESRTANMLLSYQLPNTHMNVQVPVIYEQFVNVEADNGKGRGTFPDYLVTQTYQDLLDKKDSVFEFALDLIQQSTTLGSH